MASVLSAGFGLGAVLERRPVRQYVTDARPGNGPIRDGLRFSLDSPKATFHSDERVEVTLHVSNVAQRTRSMPWDRAPWYRNFTLVVTDSSGTAVPRKLDKSETDPTVLSYGVKPFPMDIEPGKEFRVGLADLREYFALMPGHTYFVTADLAVLSLDKTGLTQLISNTLKIRLGAGLRDPDISLGEASPGGGEIEDGVQLLVDTTKHRFKPDEPVDITLHLKNLRPVPMTCGWSGGPWFWYGNIVTLKVVDDAGAAVDRKLGEVESELPGDRPEVANNEFRIPAGQELRIPLPDLRKYFAMVPGGSYHITASCVARGSERGNVPVTSNTIEVALGQP
jgi:hypothetical protein